MEALCPVPSVCHHQASQSLPSCPFQHDPQQAAQRRSTQTSQKLFAASQQACDLERISTQSHCLVLLHVARPKTSRACLAVCFDDAHETAHLGLGLPCRGEGVVGLLLLGLCQACWGDVAVARLEGLRSRGPQGCGQLCLGGGIPFVRRGEGRGCKPCRVLTGVSQAEAPKLDGSTAQVLVSLLNDALSTFLSSSNQSLRANGCWPHQHCSRR